MASTIQIRVEDDLKIKSDRLFKDLGTDTTAAIRMFLVQAVAHNGFPFEIRKSREEYNPYTPIMEEQMFRKLEISRAQEAEGKVRNAENVITDMRTKYGL